VAAVVTLEGSAMMAGKALQHFRQVVEITPGPRLVDPATGEVRSGAVHWLLVPSHSDPLRSWSVRVSWHQHSVSAWHHGEACPAYEIRGRCWHLLLAVAWVAERWHDGTVPVPERRRGRPSPRPHGRRRGRGTVAQPWPDDWTVPGRPAADAWERPDGALSRFYD
jgi:hypothetical protein